MDSTSPVGQDVNAWSGPLDQESSGWYEDESGYSEMVPPIPDQDELSRRTIPAAPKMKNLLAETISSAAAQSVAKQDSISTRKSVSQKHDDISALDIPAEEIAGSIDDAGSMSVQSPQDVEEIDSAEITESSRRVPKKETAALPLQSKTSSAPSAAIDPQFESFRLEDLFPNGSEANGDPVSAVRIGRQADDLAVTGQPRLVSAPLKNIAGKPERDLIRELRISSQQQQSALLSPARNERPDSRSEVMLTAKPVPHYQELRQIAAQSQRPIRLQTPLEFATQEATSPGYPLRESVQARPASSRERIELDPDFDFRPLPEVIPGETLEISPPQMQEFLNEVFDASEFPAPSENPTFRSLPPHTFDVGLNGNTSNFSRLPSYNRESVRQSPPSKVVLRAIPQVAPSQAGNSQLQLIKEPSKARFMQPSFDRQMFEEPIADPR